MKTKLTLIGVMSLALGACDSKKEATKSSGPDFGSAQQPIRLKPTERRTVKRERPPAPEPAVETASEAEAGDVAGADDQTAMNEAPAADSVETQGTAEEAPPATTKTTEQLREERQARMAASRQVQTARITAMMETRFKEQDANQDGRLDKSEAGQGMARRFDDADKDKDGYLDASEQSAMLQTMAEGFGQRGNRGGGGGGGQRGGNRGGGGGR